jgi:hypothetical protein
LKTEYFQNCKPINGNHWKLPKVEWKGKYGKRQEENEKLLSFHITSLFVLEKHGHIIKKF